MLFEGGRRGGDTPEDGPGAVVLVAGGAVAVVAALAVGTAVLAVIGWLLNRVLFAGARAAVERSALVLWAVLAIAALAVAVRRTGRPR